MANIDRIFSLITGLHDFYKQRDWVSLGKALTPIAGAVADWHKNNPDLAKGLASQAFDFVKNIAVNGVEFVTAHPYAVGATVVILVSAYVASKLYDWYNSFKQREQKYEFRLRSLFEDEVWPTLLYINNTLLPDWENSDPVDFCEAANVVVERLNRQAASLKELGDEIRSTEAEGRSRATKANIASKAALIGGLLMVHVTWPLAVGLGVVAGGSRWASEAVGGVASHLNELANDTENLYRMVVASRTEIDLTVAEMIRTRRQRNQEGER